MARLTGYNPAVLRFVPVTALLFAGCGGSLTPRNATPGGGAEGPADCAEPLTFYADADGDGVGVDDDTQEGCVAPQGYAPETGDCDDDDPARHPGAEETCDGVDENCDGQVDEAFGRTPFYADADADGHGDPEVVVLACAPPEGYALFDDDCDDSTDQIHPDAPEVCDGEDNDCNELVDMDDPGLDATTLVTFYRDADNDGFGVPVPQLEACSPPKGFAATPDDCNDADPSVNPGVTEVCSGRDDDCDQLIDDADPSIDPATQASYYADTDTDGLGDPYDVVSACVQPPTRVTNADDCDDADPLVGGPVDWLNDADGDGYGTGASLGLSCTGPAGSAPAQAGTDCNDADPGISPGAIDTCDDGIDQDCDGLDASCAQSFVLGSAGASTIYTQTSYVRGNRMYVPTTTWLDSYGLYLGLSGVCTLDYYVYTSTGATGPWTLQWSASVSRGPGTDYWISPFVGLNLPGGQYAALSVGWNCSATYYADYTISSGINFGPGTHQGTVWDNAYPGYSAGYIVPNNGTSSTLAYVMEVIGAP